jgi:hypothetical protein
MGEYIRAGPIPRRVGARPGGITVTRRWDHRASRTALVGEIVLTHATTGNMCVVQDSSWIRPDPLAIGIRNCTEFRYFFRTLLDWSRNSMAFFHALFKFFEPFFTLFFGRKFIGIISEYFLVVFGGLAVGTCILGWMQASKEKLQCFPNKLFTDDMCAAMFELTNQYRKVTARSSNGCRHR